MNMRKTHFHRRNVTTDIGYFLTEVISALSTCSVGEVVDNFVGIIIPFFLLFVDSTLNGAGGVGELQQRKVFIIMTFKNKQRNIRILSKHQNKPLGLAVIEFNLEWTIHSKGLVVIHRGC